MYHLIENTFIVWGQNYDTARALSAKLSEYGLHSTVGGDASFREDNKNYLSSTIISQMNKASRAIILVEGKKDRKGNFEFRPNLMFEWGYLLARLPEGSTMVALIDTPRAAIPSDLQGIFSEEVPHNLNTPDEQAAWIADTYNNKKIGDRFDPFDVIYHSTKWRTFIENQINEKSAPDPYMLLKSIPSYIIPMIYTNDIDFIRSMLFELSKNSENSSNSVHSLMGNVCDFVLHNSGRRKNDENTFSSLNLSFSSSLEYHDPFILAICRDYKGQCLVKQALIKDNATETNKILEMAIENFLQSEVEFIRSNVDERSRLIWLSYVHRRLCLSYKTIGNNRLAVDYAEKSMATRIKFRKWFDGCSNNFIEEAISSEYYNSVIDYVIITGETNFEPFRELSIVNRKGKFPENFWWKRVFDYRDRVTT